MKDLFFKQNFFELNNTYDFEKECQNCKQNYFAMNKEKLVCLVCGEKFK